jgi:hypothetical protein
MNQNHHGLSAPADLRATCEQALPAEHPIVAAVAADKQSRQSHKTLSEEELTASGAVAVHFLQGQVSSMQSNPAGVDAEQVDAEAVGLPSTTDTASQLDAQPSHELLTRRRAKARQAAAAAPDSTTTCKGLGIAEGDLLFCSKYWVIQIDPDTGGSRYSSGAVCWGQLD